jgi:hypothetical protein
MALTWLFVVHENYDLHAVINVLTLFSAYLHDITMDWRCSFDIEINKTEGEADTLSHRFLLKRLHPLYFPKEMFR